MESVDQVGRRERFMQSNFESLSGGDEASLPSSMSNSISNAWRDGTGAAATPSCRLTKQVLHSPGRAKIRPGRDIPERGSYALYIHT